MGYNPKGSRNPYILEEKLPVCNLVHVNYIFHVVSPAIQMKIIKTFLAGVYIKKKAFKPYTCTLSKVLLYLIILQNNMQKSFHLGTMNIQTTLNYSILCHFSSIQQNYNYIHQFHVLKIYTFKRFQFFFICTFPVIL